MTSSRATKALVARKSSQRINSRHAANRSICLLPLNSNGFLVRTGRWSLATQENSGGRHKWLLSTLRRSRFLWISLDVLERQKWRWTQSDANLSPILG